MTQSQEQPELDVEVVKLLDALNDEQAAQQLMDERGWSKKDLLVRAHVLHKQLAETMSRVNMV